MQMKDWDDFTPFQKWFYGFGACADGDLEQDAAGDYIMPLTQAFYDCWCAAGGERD